MKQYEFHLNIPPETLSSYYRGEVKQVFVRCRNNLSIKFPVSLLRPFITAAGVYGDFVLSCEDDHTGALLKRLP